MAFFPREFYGPKAGFTPLFHLLDDINNLDGYARNVGPRGHRHARGSHVPTFNPKFDVRELEDAFELHGELPGMDKKNVHIEFTDPQTLIIRGHIERTYEAGTPPAGLVEGTQVSGAITEGSEEKTKNDHHATVEDDPEETGSTGTGGEVTKTEAAQPKQPVDKAKYWVTERSIGEFSRTFSFPGRVNQEAVRAKLEEGVLTVVVPKAPKHEARRIDIA